MGVSLYYTATRPASATPQEQNRCDEIAQRYDDQYPYGDLYEGFCIYRWDTLEDDLMVNMSYCRVQPSCH